LKNTMLSEFCWQVGSEVAKELWLQQICKLKLFAGFEPVLYCAQFWPCARGEHRTKTAAASAGGCKLWHVISLYHPSYSSDFARSSKSVIFLSDSARFLTRAGVSGITEPPSEIRNQDASGPAL